jgi:hypothetical protein
MATGVPAMSFSPHIAIAPGGHGAGAKVGISAEVVGPGGGIGAAGGAGVARAEAGPTGGVGGAGVAKPEAGVKGRASRSAGGGRPVMLGARTIGPSKGSAMIGWLAAAACGIDSPIGEHASSHSGMALMITSDLTTRIGHTARPGFSGSAIVRSSTTGIGVLARRLASASPAGQVARADQSSLP